MESNTPRPMPKDDLRAELLMAFGIGPVPDQPTLAVFEMTTASGSRAYIVDRKHLEDLAEDFLAIAASLPRKSDLS